MNVIQRAIDAIRHPAEYDAQRARRRWRAELAKHEPVMQARPTHGRIDIECRCGHAYAEHVIESAARAACLGTAECDCVMFRAERIQVTHRQV